MAQEPFGTSWRALAPRAVFTATLPATDDRTQFIACTMYPALKDKGRYHAKLAVDEVEKHAGECIGKPLVDYHDNADGKEVGTIIAAGVDSQKRIWIRGAVNYSLSGNTVLRRMRDGHYKAVSWRMFTAPYRDPVDDRMAVEKHLLNLAIVSKPEYQDAQIYFIADDPAPVKEILSKFAPTATTSENSLETQMKKQKQPTTETRPLVIYNSDQTPMSTSVAQPTPTPTPATAVVATETPSVAKIVTPEATVPKVDTLPPTKAEIPPPAKAEVTLPAKAELPLSTLMKVDAAPPPPIAVQQNTAPVPASMQGFGAPTINYHFGTPFGSQNQFSVPSNVAPPPPTPTPTPMATTTQQQPPPVVQETTPAPPTTTASGKRKADDAGLDDPNAKRASSTTAQESANAAAAAISLSEDQFNRLFNGLAAKLAPPQPATPVPTTSVVPVVAAAATKAAEPTPTAVASKHARITNFNPMHDAIKQINQMQEAVLAEERKYENVRDLLQDNGQRLKMEKQLSDMRDKVAKYCAVLVEAFEKHDNDFRGHFKVPKNAIRDGELARMKGQLAKKVPLNERDLNYIGQSLEFISESSGGHERLLEERERELREQFERERVSAPPQEDPTLAALRQVLALDPHNGNQGAGPSRFDSSSSMPPPQPRAQAMSNAERFQRETGVPWKLIDNDVQLNHRPAPPSASVSSMVNPDTGARLYPIRHLPNSLWATGMASDPGFKQCIDEATLDAKKGVEDLLTVNDFSYQGRLEIERVMGVNNATNQIY